MDKTSIPDSSMKSMVNDIIAKQKETIKAQQEEQENVIMTGDRITAYGLTFSVGTILFQDFYGHQENACFGSDCFGFDCEFLDSKGNYHHWKQNQDGGFVERWNGRSFEKIL